MRIDWAEVKSSTYSRGEKCDTQLLTEIHVGKAIPVHQDEREQRRVGREIHDQTQADRMINKFRLTLLDLDTLYSLVEYGASTLFDELVALYAQLQHGRAFRAASYELLHHIIDDV